MKKIHWMILAGMAFVWSMVSCKHELYDPGNTGGSVNTGGTTGVCFESEILPIFQSSCAKSGCHDPSSHEDDYVLDAYANIMKKGIVKREPLKSEIYKKIIETKKDERMPPYPDSPLTKIQTDKIYQWILEGAIETKGCSNCDTTVFSFSKGVMPILESSCSIGSNACHLAPATANLNVGLKTYEQVKNVAQSGRLLSSIQHLSGFKPMPKGGNKLLDCSITVIRKWMQAGYPQN